MKIHNNYSYNIIIIYIVTATVWWKNYDNMLSRFHPIPERYGRTDGRTDRQICYISIASVYWRAIKKTGTRKTVPVSFTV